MPPKTHARLAPSAAYRWTRCPGSIHLIEQLGLADEDPTEYTEFGIACHTFAEHALKNEVGEFTPEILEMVQDYVNYVRAHVAAARLVHIESTISLDTYRPPEPIWGTPDAQVFDLKFLEIVDLKTGYIDVSPEKNEQLICYAAGAIAKMEKATDGSFADEFEVRLTIIQPRSGGTKTWVTTVGEIKERTYNIIGATWAVGPKAALVAGEHCRFCPAAGHCPELKRNMALTAQTDFDVEVVPGPVPVESVPLAQAARILERASQFYAWISALKLRVAREIAAGREVPGWKLVGKRPRRVWNDPHEVVDWARLSGLSDEEITERPVLRSPAQIEKIIGKKNLPEELYTRVSSGVTLAPASDPRPATAIGPAEEFPALQPGALENDTTTTE